MEDERTDEEVGGRNRRTGRGALLLLLLLPVLDAIVDEVEEFGSEEEADDDDKAGLRFASAREMVRADTADEFEMEADDAMEWPSRGRASSASCELRILKLLRVAIVAVLEITASESEVVETGDDEEDSKTGTKGATEEDDATT